MVNKGVDELANEERVKIGSGMWIGKAARKKRKGRWCGGIRKRVMVKRSIKRVKRRQRMKRKTCQHSKEWRKLGKGKDKG